MRRRGRENWDLGLVGREVIRAMDEKIKERLVGLSSGNEKNTCSCMCDI